MYNVNHDTCPSNDTGYTPYRILKNQARHLRRRIQYKSYSSQKTKIINFPKYIGNVENCDCASFLRRHYKILKNYTKHILITCGPNTHNKNDNDSQKNNTYAITVITHTQHIEPYMRTIEKI